MKLNLLFLKWYKTNIYKLVKHDHSLFSLTVSLTTSTQIRRIPNTYKFISSPTQTTPVWPSQAWWMDWISHSRLHQPKPKEEIPHTKNPYPHTKGDYVYQSHVLWQSKNNEDLDFCKYLCTGAAPSAHAKDQIFQGYQRLMSVLFINGM